MGGWVGGWVGEREKKRERERERERERGAPAQPELVCVSKRQKCKGAGSLACACSYDRCQSASTFSAIYVSYADNV